ncbi:hypothetical protein DL93DRAFT_2231313 [Clavulina sp. PMI_390]|nr:hypothetical protein DL93DRAFT_2231313 [Clavulina sp. PMI_390]
MALHATILQQSVETLDAIALEIDKASDLLSLGLTCKAFYALVSPRHIRFRVIRARLEDRRLLPVWDLLARDKTLARNVRVLDIQPTASTNPRFLIPFDKGLISASRRISKSRKISRASRYNMLAHVVENHFAPALTNMTRLISFSWKKVNRENTVRLESLTDFTWKSIEHYDYEGSWRIFEEFEIPNIERLCFEFPPWSNNSKWHLALNDVCWPRLRCLEFIGCIPDREDTIHPFLKRHPAIEELAISLPYLPPDSCRGKPFLPNLRVLSIFASLLPHTIPLISSNSLHTVTITSDYTPERIVNALRLRPSIVHVNFKYRPFHGMFELLAEELPGLQSVNGVPFTGNVGALKSSLRWSEDDGNGEDDGIADEYTDSWDDGEDSANEDGEWDFLDAPIPSESW